MRTLLGKYWFSILLLIITSCSKPDQSGGQDDQQAGSDNEKPFRFVLPMERIHDNGDYSWDLVAYDINKHIVWEKNDLASSAPNRDLAYANGILYASKTRFRFIGNGPAYEHYHELVAIDVSDGRVVWGRVLPSGQSITSLYVEGNTLYASGSGQLARFIFGYNCLTGEETYRHGMIFPYLITYVVTDGNMAYFTTATSSTVNTIMALDMSTKAILWSKELGANIANAYSQPVVSKTSVIISNAAGRLIVLDKRSGIERWTVDGVGTGQPVYKAGRIFVAAGLGVYSYEELSGGQHWLWKLSEFASWYKGGSPFVTTSIGVMAGANNDGHFIAAVDNKSGSQKWLARRETSSHFPVIVADNVYTIDEARQAGQVPVLLQTDLETGIATDSIVLSGRLFAEPIIIGESGQGYRPN